MSKEAITRFDMDMDGSMEPSEHGQWVRYEDVQLQQEQPLPLVEIGVDVTSDGASVVAFYRRQNAVMEMFYSQFHPQPKQEKGEPVGEIISWPDDFSRLGVKWVDSCPPERTKLYTTPQPKQEKGEPVACIHRNEYNEYRLEPHDNFDIKSIPFNIDVPLFKGSQPAQRPKVVFPTMLRKMWSGGEVQAWLDENVNKGNNNA